MSAPSSLLLVDYSDDEPSFTLEILATTQGEPSPPPSPIADQYPQLSSLPSLSSILPENLQTSNPISPPPETMPSSNSPQIHTTPSSTPVPRVLASILLSNERRFILLVFDKQVKPI